jgi:ribonuclease HIII
MSQTPKKGIFVANVPVVEANRMHEELKEMGYTFSQPPHTIFQAKKGNVSCTFYQSGKLVVQGKGMDELIEFYLEPQVLKTFGFAQQVEHSFEPRIGIDESGKGDFFGPLCVAGVFGGKEEVERLAKIGVRDSKEIKDNEILRLGKEIESFCSHYVIRINPIKYNELYPKFGNLNTMLGWAHATTIENLVKKTGCRTVTIDQFAHESVVKKALKGKKDLREIDLTQRHRGESDILVAAASILARKAFILALSDMEKKFGMKFPKGASSATIKAGREYAQKYGEEALPEVGKMHFKTLDSIR